MATPQLSSVVVQGFFCEFVENPPAVIQSDCPVCLQVLREPYQAPCCGNSFCKACIERIKGDNKPCPTCKEENFVTFHNKGLERSLYGFRVYCSHKQEGCEWKGELGQLDKHLNLSPQPDKQLEGCEYSEIECKYCFGLMKRPSITTHQTEQCPKRPFSCEYCGTYKTQYEDIVNNHWPVCDYHPVECPNECGKSLERRAIDPHIATECLKAIIDCDFHQVGCDVKLPRKDMPAHLNENMLSHMTLQLKHQNGMLAMLQKRVDELEKENQIGMFAMLQKRVDELEKENKILKVEMEQQKAASEVEVRTTHQIVKHLGLPSSHSGFIEITMTGFNRHKQKDDEWYSSPFYTHPGGYKLCLSVNADGCGDGKGTHVSVFVYLMRGDFDDNLKWPFHGQVIISLVNQKGNGSDHSYYVNFETAVRDARARVKRYRCDTGWGTDTFISNNDLKRSYLKDDCLYFRLICKNVGF